MRTIKRLVVIPALRWTSVVKELVRVTRPGGYVDQLEVGYHFENAGSATQRFLTWWHQVSIKSWFNSSLMEHLGRCYAEQAGRPFAG